MKIGNEYLYVGAYAERLHDRKIERRKRPSSPSKCPDHILGPDGKQRAVVTLKISLKGQTMYDLFKKERYKGLDFEDCAYSDQIERLKHNTNVQNDPFAMNPCDEWITFSEFLYQNHYFDQMNEEEVKDFEEKFMYITNGMDEFNMEHNPHIGGTRHTFCEYKVYDRYKDSLSDDSADISPYINGKTIEEETTVLESSIAALQYLSDKLLPASLQDGFNQLIDQYRQHNESVLKDYEPSVLTPEVARMILYSMHSGPLDPPSQDSFYEKATHDFKYLMLRRKISTPYRDTRSYAQLVADTFHSFCASRNPEVIYQKIKDHYIDFATRGSKDAGFYDYISSHELEASTACEHSTSRLIRECWKNTFALEERYSQKYQ
ncbi:MAG: hypothetical protein HXK81_09065 [Lachnospiraceae bacterium]|nr:hypothetical protein [Lachnospiraceae bacterium]